MFLNVIWNEHVGSMLRGISLHMVVDANDPSSVNVTMIINHSHKSLYSLVEISPLKETHA